MVEHFAAQVQNEIGGKAKAMIVTRSRRHAVRYKLAVDRYLKEKGYPFQALVAFSGKVEEPGESYTEAGMNSAGEKERIGERQTAKEFEKPEYRFLSWPTSSRPGSTSRSCTRCTWTRSSAA